MRTTGRRRAGARVAMLFAFATVPTGAGAQASDPHQVQPERPTVATHAGTVAPGWLEIESGAEFDRLDGVRSTLVPTALKFGVAPRMQASVFVNLVKPPAGTLGIGDLALGVKWRFAESLPVLGDLALLPSIKTPTGSATAGRGTGTTDGSLLLISSHDTWPVAMDINAGLTRRSGDGSAAPRTATVWTVSLGGSLLGGLGWTGELYGYPGTSGRAGSAPIVAVLGGPTLRARKWLALDVGVIVPVTGPQPHALYFGGVYNVGRWR